ncbi:hypothetical protein ACJMK2_012575, partial [Sinanodonta woodiana]
FRGCLKSSVSSTASLIGRIYFNILGSKCFTFKEEEVCEERSWWGYCQKYQVQSSAVLRDNDVFLCENKVE